MQCTPLPGQPRRETSRRRAERGPHSATYVYVCFSKKIPLRENAHTAKNVLRINIFSGKGVFTYYQFSHLTTIFFIWKNSYFSYTIFLLEHNGILLQHNEVLLQHHGVLLQHNGVLLQHNGVLLQHNGVLLKHNGG